MATFYDSESKVSFQYPEGWRCFRDTYRDDVITFGVLKREPVGSERGDGALRSNIYIRLTKIDQLSELANCTFDRRTKRRGFQLISRVCNEDAAAMVFNRIDLDSLELVDTLSSELLCRDSFAKIEAGILEVLVEALQEDDEEFLRTADIIMLTFSVNKDG